MLSLNKQKSNMLRGENTYLRKLYAFKKERMENKEHMLNYSS